MYAQPSLSAELAELAARHIVEEGLSYAQAKRKAAKQAGIAEHNAAMPANSLVEQAVRDYLAEHAADTQPAVLADLRRLALNWMHRLEGLQGEGVTAHCLAHGAVVNATATDWSGVHIHVFTEDSKYLELALLNRGFTLDASEQVLGGQARCVLVVHEGEIPVVLTLMPASDYRVPKLRAGETVWQSADIAGLQALLD